MSEIWIFRERRSGSTALSDYLSLKFNRKNIYISDFEKLKILYWQDKIVTTHNFGLLENLHKYANPVILRCSRKNKLEQFISDFISDSEQNYNLYKDGSTNLDWLINAKPRKITRQHFEIWENRMLNMNYMWQQHSNQFKNYTIYYEDMFKPIDILGFNNCKILEESTTLKLPEYKTKIILNYEEVCDWFNNSSFMK